MLHCLTELFLNLEDCSNKSWNWDFGDANVSFSNFSGFASNSWPGIGLYDVKLVVTDGNNCQDSTIQTIQVIQGADANFFFNTVCLGAATTLDATIGGLGSDNDRWYWDFGNNGVIDVGPRFITCN